MYKQSTKPKTLRQRGILLIESLAVIIAVIVALAYLTTNEVVEVPDNDVAGVQDVTTAEQVAEAPATIDPEVVKTLACKATMLMRLSSVVPKFRS